MKRSLLFAASVMLLIGLSTAPALAELPPIPAPTTGLFNGNFEITAEGVEHYPYGWTETYFASSGALHTGLNATGLEPETQAVSLKGAAYPIVQEVVSSKDWEMGFLGAACKGTSPSLRVLYVMIRSGSSVSPYAVPRDQISLYVDGNGNMKAYNGSAWALVASGVFTPSIDGDGDGKLESEEDTLNVHSFKIVGNYDDTPSYDVYMSAANSETLNLVAANVNYFHERLPKTGSEILGTGVCGVCFNNTPNVAVVDEVYFTSTGIPPIIGDTNCDGRVDGDDAAIMASHWQQELIYEDVAWRAGDFNGDNVVNDIDATLLAANWRNHLTLSSVPEPSCLVLISAALLLLFIVKRRTV